MEIPKNFSELKGSIAHAFNTYEIAVDNLRITEDLWDLHLFRNAWTVQGIIEAGLIDGADPDNLLLELIESCITKPTTLEDLIDQIGSQDQADGIDAEYPEKPNVLPIFRDLIK